ncbi:MAG: glycosyltransferase family 2 protein [Bacteroidia bacterium]|nr:glycosyltransferase family 2 protein [Bacteroidia bacterium]
MLSVCIPVFNNDITKLVHDLQLQFPAEAEIILIDDCSDDSFKTQYRNLQNEKIRVVLLNENIGRARIRNLFLKFAQYDNLLFLDSDSMIVQSDFLKKYIKCIQNNYAVVCGGRIYSTKIEDKKYLLHWKYGVTRESKTEGVRNLQPYRSFMTNNFMIQKKVFQQIHFNDKLTGYGHEDTLIGFELMKAGIRIEHINNPVLHGQLETNKEFLEKTKSSISNLLLILKEVDNDPDFINNVSLLKTFFHFRKKGLYPILYILSPLFIPIVTFIIRSGFINLRLFDLYKLLVLSRMYSK